ncbi:hypothetical protein GCM10025778_09860 [Paeniglutamicibacter antarcticus]|uniref:TetR family transcriptional regulator n=1 Tax=Paeniglutamicibacter antarcticus TaxID=494023 RepID=A0ABP9TL16_9MICC
MGVDREERAVRPVEFRRDHQLDLYDAQIVTNVTGRSAATRKRLANGRETRAFLDAALDLTTDFLTPEASARSLLDDEEDARLVMPFLSRRKVLKKAKENYGRGFPLSENMLRHRWNTHSDFLADFVSYALSDKYWTLHDAICRQAESLLTTTEAFTAAVHKAAYEDLLLVFELPAFKFQLLAVATAQADLSSAQSLVRMYDSLSELWTSMYEKVFDHYGFKFRPGITAEDINILLQATSEGLVLRLLSGVNEPLLDHERQTSLLGTAALSFFFSLVDPGDKLTLEQAVEQAVGQLRHK